MLGYSWRGCLQDCGFFFFFKENALPKSITHTNLVLLPKKDIIQYFLDMGPINLSNFLNKVISRILHDRLEKLLPMFISKNQSDLTKGRSITESILLSQEIITDIRKRGKPTKVMNLHMVKSYDRVDLTFLVKVIQKTGFDKDVKNSIWSLLVNNWYSNLINGQDHGCFHSTR